MTVNVSSPVTGGAQTGFTTPALVLVADSAPDVNGKQQSVASFTGTMTGARSGTISDPFTITVTRPKVPKTLASPNPVTGRYGSIPKNTYTMVIRKGVNVAANLAPQLMLVRVSIDVPAGADAYDAPNIRAAMSLLVGALNQVSAGFGDTVVTGVL